MIARDEHSRGPGSGRGGGGRGLSAGNETWSGNPDEGFEGDDWRGWSAPYAASRGPGSGIRARSVRGAFGEHWWSRRWVEIVEGFRLSGRLTRGKAYARAGQVTAVRFEAGRVLAHVQGSQEEPYAVVIATRPVTHDEWKFVSRELRRRPLVAAMLAAGTLHEQVETVFEAAGCPLFPTGFGELSTKCSCSDWSNPCKHVAAVFYLIAEELDRDGMLLLRLRGIERQQLATLLPRPVARQVRATQSTDIGDLSIRRPGSRLGDGNARYPLPSAPDDFWSAAEPDSWDPGEMAPPPATAPLVQRLGAFPLWRGSEPFEPAMQVAYSAASAAAIELAGRIAAATD